MAAGTQADAFVARQPIYDAALAVIAYELLYRRSAKARGAEIAHPSAATLEVIANATLDIGLTRLAGGLPVHINFPRELLAVPPELPRPASPVVIEVLEDVRAEPEVTAGILALRSRGHRIALENYWPDSSDVRLLDYADIVKIEVARAPHHELARVVRELKGRGLTLLAENVETPEHFDRCVALGFHGFQGYFLQQPQTFGARRIPGSRMGLLRLVTSLYAAEYTVEEMTELLAQNVALSYHVLRCVNSSVYNLPRKVESIREAVVILGLENLRQLCALLALQELKDRPSSLLVTALARARMCEQLGRLGGARDRGPFFMTGLLSIMNAILGVSMERVVDELPVSPAVARALLTGEGVLGEALQCARAYERSAWNLVHFKDVPAHLIRAAYVDALFWADQSRMLAAA